MRFFADVDDSIVWRIASGRGMLDHNVTSQVNGCPTVADHLSSVKTVRSGKLHADKAWSDFKKQHDGTS